MTKEVKEVEQNVAEAAAEAVSEAVVVDPKANLVGTIAVGTGVVAIIICGGLIVKKLIDKKKAEEAELEEPADKVDDIPKTEVAAEVE